MVKYQCTKYKYRRNIMQSTLLTGMWSLEVGGFCYLLWKYVCKYLIYIKYTYGFAYRIGLPVWVHETFFLRPSHIWSWQVSDVLRLYTLFVVAVSTFGVWPRQFGLDAENRRASLDQEKSSNLSSWKKKSTPQSKACRRQKASQNLAPWKTHEKPGDLGHLAKSTYSHLVTFDSRGT